MLSTIHTVDSIEVITRLRKLGISSYDVGSVLAVSIAQRLVRRVCKECATQRPLNEKEIAEFNAIAKRYDVKGKKYIKTPAKYYFTDVGLRNARLGFRQQEETHIMENVLYCDLLRRGFDVDVGVVEYNYKKEDGKSARVQLEIDFVVNRGNQRYYIQSALSIADPEKRAQEINSLVRVPDSFRKIVVVGDRINPWKDDNGILYIGIEQFLLDENAINM